MKKPILVMIQSPFCGHCVSAKPAFQQLALMDDVICGTIDMNIEPALAKRINSIVPQFRGVPTYLLFKDGLVVAEYNGDRSTYDLRNFYLNNILQ